MAMVCAGLLAAATTEWDGLPGTARGLLAQLGINARNLAQTLRTIDERTSSRLSDGDWDEAVYYMLQSRTFTDTPPIEPSRAALYPDQVRTRMDAFLKALAKPANDRMYHFASLAPTRAELEARYRRAMEFLYRKEVRCRESDGPQECIAALYADRGLSTDTSEQAFRVVEAAAPWVGKPKRVLILGPGVDFAPRTALHEDGPPRVYQPVQVRLLFRPDAVDCVDVNPLVIAYAKSECSSVYRLNIATGFVDGAEPWDLIIATNVLLYLDDRELLLAMANVRRMLKPGGEFLHNDGRFAVSVFGKACGMPVEKFGSVVLDGQRRPPLTDRYVLHRLGAI
jgi:SAM-dependent methyltransferase